MAVWVRSVGAASLTLLALVPWGWCVRVAALDRRHRLSLDGVEPVREGLLASAVVPARDEERGVRPPSRRWPPRSTARSRSSSSSNGSRQPADSSCLG